MATRYVLILFLVSGLFRANPHPIQPLRTLLQIRFPRFNYDMAMCGLSMGSLHTNGGHVMSVVCHSETALKSLMHIYNWIPSVQYDRMNNIAELLNPTRIYVKEVTFAFEHCDALAIVS